MFGLSELCVISKIEGDLHMINPWLAHKVPIKHSGSQSFISVDCDKY
jgi:hypothetical protein